MNTGGGSIGLSPQKMERQKRVKIYQVNKVILSKNSKLIQKVQLWIIQGILLLVKTMKKSNQINAQMIYKLKLKIILTFKKHYILIKAVQKTLFYVTGNYHMVLPVQMIFIWII